MIGIYGANGFVGRTLVRRLADLGHPVRAVSRKIDEDLRLSCAKNVEFVEIDVRDPIATADSLRGLNTVVQLASTSSPASQNRHAIVDIEQNLMPHVALMQAAVEEGIRRYVFVSSGGTVYGPGAMTPTPEHAPTNPICSHGLIKLTIEKYLQMHATVSGLETVILRVANAYGPEQTYKKGQGLIPAVLGKIAMGLPVQVVGKGMAVRDYVFIEDVVDAIQLSVFRADMVNGTFNIGSGKGLSVLQVLESLEHALGIRIARTYVPARNTDMDVSVLDIRAAERDLDWRPKTTFSDGIQHTVAWWRQRGLLNGIGDARKAS